MSPSPPDEAAPEPDLAFDPLVPGFFDDPYPSYAVLRAEHPVYFEPRVDAYLVTRYDDVHRLCRDRTMLSDFAQANPTPRIESRLARDATLAAGSRTWMLFLDGEEHARLRRAFSSAFTPRVVGAWQPRIEAVVDRLLAAVADDDTFDVLSRFAAPLPAQIISEMIGVPDADIPQLLDWSEAQVRYFESFNTPEQDRAAVDAIRDMTDYFRALMAAKRARPGNDILSALLAGSGEDALAPDEIVSQMIFLHGAGHGTTKNLIGTGLAHLFAHPDQMRRLRADPGLDGNAIEELLRFDGPIQFARRIAQEPIELHGETIPAGGDVMLSLAAANRDPEKWGEGAESLDLSRPDAAEHVAFSGGAHFCLGAPLARLEARIALPRLLRRFPDLAPAYDRPTWATRVVLRGVDHLPVHPGRPRR